MQMLAASVANLIMGAQLAVLTPTLTLTLSLTLTLALALTLSLTLTR